MFSLQNTHFSVLTKLADQFERLERLKDTQLQLIESTEMLLEHATSMSEEEHKPISVRHIVDQHFSQLVRAQMVDLFKPPSVKAIFFVSESEYAEHEIICDRGNNGEYIIQAPVSSSYTTALLVGEIFSRFTLGSTYYIHNQNDSSGEIELLDPKVDIIWDGISENNGIYNAANQGMLYIPPCIKFTAMSSVIIELRPI